MTSEGIDLPVLVEGIEEFYRNVYACPLLGPIFRGINMVVLRKHVSYFLHSITMWDTPMSPHQLKYLTRAHRPLLTSKGVTRVHFDSMLHHLRDAMLACGADPQQLDRVEQKLAPFRATFPTPPDLDTGADSGTIIPHVCASLAPGGTTQPQQGAVQQQVSIGSAVAAAAGGAAGRHSFSSRSSSSGEDSDGEPHLVVVQREDSCGAEDAPRPLHLTHPHLAPLLIRSVGPPTPTTDDEPRGGFSEHRCHQQQPTASSTDAPRRHSSAGPGSSRTDCGRRVLQAVAVGKARHTADMGTAQHTPTSSSAPTTPGAGPACAAAPPAAAGPAAAPGVCSGGVAPAALSRSRVKGWFQRLIKCGQ